MNLLVRNLSVLGLGVCAALPSLAAAPQGQTYAELGYGWLKLSSSAV